MRLIFLQFNTRAVLHSQERVITTSKRNFTIGENYRGQEEIHITKIVEPRRWQELKHRVKMLDKSESLNRLHFSYGIFHRQILHRAEGWDIEQIAIYDALSTRCICAAL